MHGVGNKTARFFLLHSRENCEHVVLDIHILRYLRERWKQDVPDNTPQNNKQYKEIADKVAYFIKTDFPYLTMAEADLLIWTKGSGRLENDESINQL